MTGRNIDTGHGKIMAADMAVLTVSTLDIVVRNMWYDPKSVSGGFVGKLDNELAARGFQLEKSGPTQSMTNYAGVASGVMGVYYNRAGECVIVNNTGATLLRGELLIRYDVHHLGVPSPSGGSSGEVGIWSHDGKTTDIYTTDSVPTKQYDPGITAKEVLAKVGVIAGTK